MIKLISFGFILQVFLYGQSTIDITTLLSDSVEDWRISDAPEAYMGEDLFKLIDGGADIFHEYGFKQVITQRYHNSNDKIISVEVYEMIDSSAAFGIFSLFTFKTGKRINFSSGASEGDEFLIFWKGNYYVTLSGYEVSKEIKNGFFLIAQSIESKIKSGGRPGVVNIFDPMENAKLAYLKGNLGLYNLSNIDLGRSFNVKEGICIEKDSLVNFIFKYKTEEVSKNEFKSLCQELRGNETYNLINSNVFSPGEAGFLFKDNRDLYNYITQLHDYIIILSAKDVTLISSTLVEIKNLLK
jgi:hypothetical protein